MWFKSKVVITAAALTGVLMVGVAYAAFDGVIMGTDGVIYACAKTDGAVRLAGSSRTCDAGEKSFNWNQRGLRGPTGPQGMQGPAYFARVLTTDNDTYKFSSSATMRSWNYSDGTVWLNVPGHDVRSCAVSATPVGAPVSAHVIRQKVDYQDWILMYSYVSGTRARMDVDVILACSY